MKILIFISFILAEQCKIFGQIPAIKHNYTKQDSTENPLIDSFSKTYDFIIAYTEQSYWWSDKKSYKILSCANNKWSLWTYSDYFAHLTKKKRSKKTAIDTVRKGQFFESKTKFQDSAIGQLLTNFSNNGFWTLSNDSLNQTYITTRIENGDTITTRHDISDGINYRFDILTKDKLRVIQSYEPDYFVKLFPAMIDRKQFIKSRDFFLSWWDKYYR